MTTIFDSLPTPLRDELQPLVERARLPFVISLDRVVGDFRAPLLELRRLGASVGAIAQLLAEIGVTSEGRPVAAATLSKAFSRARAKSASGQDAVRAKEMTSDQESATVRDVEGPTAAKNGTTRQRAAFEDDARRMCDASIGDAENLNSKEGGALRQKAAVEGKARHTNALTGSARRIEAISGNSNSNASDRHKRETPVRSSSGATTSNAARNERSRQFEASLSRGRTLNSLQEDER